GSRLSTTAPGLHPMHDPAIETLPWAQQAGVDDATYRRQVGHLFAHSPFYREKLRSEGFRDAAAVGGICDIARLPFTEKDELRSSRTAENPVGGHLAAPMSEIVRI